MACAAALESSVSAIPAAILATVLDVEGMISKKSYLPRCRSPARNGTLGDFSLYVFGKLVFKSLYSLYHFTTISPAWERNTLTSRLCSFVTSFIILMLSLRLSPHPVIPHAILIVMLSLNGIILFERFFYLFIFGQLRFQSPTNCSFFICFSGMFNDFNITTIASTIPGGPHI